MSIFDPTWRSIGLALSRAHFHRQKPEQITFTRSVSDARHALLILPMHSLELVPLATVIDLLRRKFQDKHITVITPMHSVELMRLLPHGRFVRLEPGDVNRFYLPRKEMIHRMPRAQYDLAIDLNLDFVLPSGYICRESNAHVRVGIAGKHSDLFYNFLIQTATGQPGTQVYDRLATCLAMF